MLPMPIRICALLLLALTCAACGDEEAAQREQEAKAQAFAAAEQPWRAQRQADLTRPDGWTSLIGLHWIQPGEHYIGSDADNGIRLAMGPAHVGLISRKDGRIRFVPENGVPLTLDGEPVKGAVTLLTDADPNGPSKLGFGDGKGLITVIRRADRYALRVRHADASTRTGFKGIEYWPGGQDWVVRARFIPHPAGKTLPIANIVGTTENMPNPGVVEFERDGQRFRLEAVDEGDRQLSLIFADRTSGKGSYPAGRFLDAPLPDAQGNVMLDFNKTYNPPCAFTAYATCPLPPTENRLNLEVTAGEKMYHFEERKSS